jgi:hypothetical protein
MKEEVLDENSVRSAFCDEKKASTLTGLSATTLMRERKSGRLAYSRIGGVKRGRVFYSMGDLVELANKSKLNA